LINVVPFLASNVLDMFALNFMSKMNSTELEHNAMAWNALPTAIESCIVTFHFGRSLDVATCMFVRWHCNSLWLW